MNEKEKVFWKRGMSILWLLSVATNVCFLFFIIEYLNIKGQNITLESAYHFQDAILQKQQVFLQETFDKYQACLKREKKIVLQAYILRKKDRAELQKVIDFNRKRAALWQKKEKPEILKNLSLSYKLMDGLEKSAIEYKLVSPTFWDATEDSM